MTESRSMVASAYGPGEAINCKGREGIPGGGNVPCYDCGDGRMTVRDYENSLNI